MLYIKQAKHLLRLETVNSRISVFTTLHLMSQKVTHCFFLFISVQKEISLINCGYCVVVFLSLTIDMHLLQNANEIPLISFSAHLVSLSSEEVWSRQRHTT